MMEQAQKEAVWLEYSEKLLALAIQLSSEPEIKSTSKGSADPHVVAILLLLRSISNFKGLLALARLGMIVEARVLCRCCVENLLWLGRLMKEQDSFVREMGLDEVRSRLKRAEFASGISSLSLEDTARLKTTAARLKAEWPKARLLNPKEVAGGNAIEPLYLLYSQLSADAAHPSLDALARHLVRVDGGAKATVRGVDLLPRAKPDEMAATLEQACVALMGSCVTVNDYLGPLPAKHYFVSAADEYQVLKVKTQLG